jgi:thioredoxin-like negative regulator of GroEL
MTKPAVTAVALLVASVLALAVYSGAITDMFTPAPQLQTSLRLIEGRKFEEAEDSLRTFLAKYPENMEARLTLAQLLMERDDPPAREILMLLAGPTGRLGRAESAKALIIEGQSHEVLHELRAAEDCYRRAERSGITAPRAVWRLMQLYYLEGRRDENQELVLDFVSRARRPSERASYLREHLRHEVQRLSATGLAEDLKAPYGLDPTDRHVAIAYGRALVGDGQLDEGLSVLKANRDRHADAESWHAYLAGLDESGDHKALKTALSTLPESLAADPRFAGLRGQVALNDGDYSKAVATLEASLAVQRADRKTLFRLERALRLAGSEDRAKEVGRRLNSVVQDHAEQAELYNRLAMLDERGMLDSADLLRRVAEVRRRLGYPDEAALWDALAK